MGHYLRVQEAASLLGVAPTTVRWYCAQGWLPTYWVGRGQVGHRRFLYKDVEALGRRLGRVIPPERDWSTCSNWDVGQVAEYLGLSAKFLIGVGLVQPGMNFTWKQVQEVEGSMYGEGNFEQEDMEDKKMDTNENAEMREDPRLENDPRLNGMHEGHHHHGHGPDFRPDMRGMMNGRRAWFGPGSHRGMNGWGGPGEWFDVENLDATNLLALKKALRHLETRKQDLEDEIAEVKKKIEMHPDYTGE